MNHETANGKLPAAPVVQGVVMALAEDQMVWSCCDCRTKFPGPKNRMPDGGCPSCGSSRVFDCNVELVIFECGPSKCSHDYDYQNEVMILNEQGKVVGGTVICMKCGARAIDEAMWE